MKLPIITIEQIGALREAALANADEYPYRPLLLELALLGLSRWSLASLKVTSFAQGVKGVYQGKPTTLPYALIWYERNNVQRRTRLPAAHWEMAQDYLDFRRRYVYINSNQLFVARSGDSKAYWKPMKPERVRSEIRTLGREAYVSEQLEIPDLHRGMANAMRFQGFDEQVIEEYFGKKAYVYEQVQEE